MPKMKIPEGTATYTKVKGPEEGGGGIKLERWKPNPSVQSSNSTGRNPQGTPSTDSAKKGKS